MSECCLTTTDQSCLGLGGRSFLLTNGDMVGRTEVNSCDVKGFPASSPSISSYSSSSSSSSSSSFSSSFSCSGRSSLKRPKAIGLRRFDFSLVHDEFSDCPMSQQPLHEQRQQEQQQQLWEYNRSTSDKTFERGRQSSWSSFSLSLPCLSTSITSGQPTNILPFLFLGSQHDAFSEDFIKDNRITHILNVSKSSPRSPFVPEVNFLRIPVNDGHTDRLLPHFQQAFQFLDEVRISNGCALVHCLAGISRSPTLVIAYVMRSLAMTSDEAYSFVKEKRSSISPNFNFLGQLVEFEALCRQKLNDESDERKLIDYSSGLQDSVGSESAQESSATSCQRDRKLVKNEPCSVSSSLKEFPSDIQDDFEKEAGNLKFPYDLEARFSHSSTHSLDQLCFAPRFDPVPDRDAKEIGNSGDTLVSGSANCPHGEQHLESKSRSGRSRRHAPRPPRGSIGSTIPFGLGSIKSPWKTSLKTSIFKRIEHHNKPVLLMD